MENARQKTVKRKTRETDIHVSINIDGQGVGDIDTGIGFFDHMLVTLVKHAAFDLSVRCHGDLQIDGHHTVEDVGIALGKAFSDALGDKKGVARFGHALVPLDEALSEVVIDLSGRPFLAFNMSFSRDRIGELDTDLLEEFYRGFAMSAALTLHINKRCGKNDHHVAESGFKAFARALRMACAHDPRAGEAVPSTKGSL
ncbi:MAG: imidazoleglycerol-phosphate dehydratase HisB [Acetobacteraceae bacterium]